MDTEKVHRGLHRDDQELMAETEVKTKSSKKLHQCHYCEQSFRQEIGVRIHESVHWRRRPIQCDTCGEEFERLPLLRQHKRLKRQSGHTKCSPNGKVKEKLHKPKPRNTELCYLKAHKADIREGGPTQCLIAETAVTTESFKRLHQCHYCEDSFRQEIGVRIHENVHFRRPIQCDTCGEKFVSLANLRQHKRLERQSGHTKCSSYGKVKKKLHKPKPRNTELCYLKAYKADIRQGRPTQCSVSLGPRNRKNPSKLEKLNIIDRSYKCTTCGETFDRIFMLLCHKKLHQVQETPPRQQCDICGEVFDLNIALINHKKVHSMGETSSVDVAKGEVSYAIPSVKSKPRIAQENVDDQTVEPIDDKSHSKAELESVTNAEDGDYFLLTKVKSGTTNEDSKSTEPTVDSDNLEKLSNPEDLESVTEHENQESIPEAKDLESIVQTGSRPSTTHGVATLTDQAEDPLDIESLSKAEQLKSFKHAEDLASMSLVESSPDATCDNIKMSAQTADLHSSMNVKDSERIADEREKTCAMRGNVKSTNTTIDLVDFESTKRAEEDESSLSSESSTSVTQDYDKSAEALRSESSANKDGHGFTVPVVGKPNDDNECDNSAAQKDDAGLEGFVVPALSMSGVSHDGSKSTDDEAVSVYDESTAHTGDSGEIESFSETKELDTVNKTEDSGLFVSAESMTAVSNTNSECHNNKSADGALDVDDVESIVNAQSLESVLASESKSGGIHGDVDAAGDLDGLGLIASDEHLESITGVEIIEFIAQAGCSSSADSDKSTVDTESITSVEGLQSTTKAKDWGSISPSESKSAASHEDESLEDQALDPGVSELITEPKDLQFVVQNQNRHSASNDDTDSAIQRVHRIDSETLTEVEKLESNIKTKICNASCTVERWSGVINIDNDLKAQAVDSGELQCIAVTSVHTKSKDRVIRDKEDSKVRSKDSSEDSALHDCRKLPPDTGDPVDLVSISEKPLCWDKDNSDAVADVVRETEKPFRIDKDAVDDVTAEAGITFDAENPFSCERDDGDNVIAKANVNLDAEKPFSCDKDDGDNVIAKGETTLDAEKPFSCDKDAGDDVIAEADITFDTEKSFSCDKDDGDNVIAKSDITLDAEKPFSCDKNDGDDVIADTDITLNAQKPFGCDKDDSVEVIAKSDIALEAENPFQCDYCESWFKNEHGARAHMSIPQCDKCGTKFRCLGELKAHKIAPRRDVYSQCFVTRLSRRGGKLHTKADVYKFKCVICSKKFMSESGLKQHLSNKHKDDVKHFPCDVCDMVFHLESLLDTHRKVHTDGELYQCDVCQQSFTRSSSLKSHLASHPTVSRHFCGACGEGFETSLDLSEHRRSEMHGKMYECDYCKKIYLSKWGLLSHYKAKIECGMWAGKYELEEQVPADDRTFKVSKETFNQTDSLTDHTKTTHLCSICGQFFAKKRDWTAHINSHVKPYKCDLCSMSFARQSTLMVHKVVHSGEKPFKCDICGRAFKRYNDVQVHKVIHTEEKPYQCKICGKSFKRKREELRHQSVHEELRPFSCDCCDDTFKRLRDLKNHKKKHDLKKCGQAAICKNSVSGKHVFDQEKGAHVEGKQCVCTLCGKSVPQDSSKRAAKVNSRNFLCEICGKSFAIKYYLDAHRVTHTKERRYKCGICQKSFTRSDTLKTHQSVHSEAKPYDCDVCGKAFKTLRTLRLHKVVHSQDTPYKCDICGDAFKRKISLTRHRKIHTQAG